MSFVNPVQHVPGNCLPHERESVDASFTAGLSNPRNEMDIGCEVGLWVQIFALGIVKNQVKKYMSLLAT